MHNTAIQINDNPNFTEAFKMAIKTIEAVEKADAELAESSVYDSHTIKAQRILRGESE